MRRIYHPTPELDRLLSGLADERLDDAGERRLAEILKADEEARRYYLRYMSLHGSLQWEYADAAAEPEISLFPSPKTVTRRWAIPLAAAAAVSLAAFPVYLSVNESKSEIATLEFADGAVFWTMSGGEQVSDLNAGAKLPAGTLVMESENGSAQIRFNDGSLVTFTGETEVDISENPGKKLVMRRGRVSADVEPQKPGRPLRIVTASAEIEVLGTVLSVTTADERTMLDVDEGLVRMRRLADGREVEVPGQHRAVVSLDSSTDLVPSKAAPIGDSWTFEAKNPGRQISKGQPGFDGEKRYLTAERYIAGRRNEDEKIVRKCVCLKDGPNREHGLVRLTEDSVVQVSSRGDARPSILLIMARPNGQFGGNFEYRLEESENLAGAGGWRTAEIPVSEFKLVNALKGRDFELAGNTVQKILVSVSKSDELDVAAVSISPRPTP